MDKQPILSICIPTNGIVEWMIPVVESIYAQEVDNSLFEVVITDNGSKDDLERALQAYCYSNLHYYKTNAQGFTNQIDAFEKCSGLFCKMLNHRSKLRPGSLKKLLSLIEKYKDERPILYCAEGHAKGGDLIECENINVFVNKLSYYVSWSAGTGVWRSDVIDIRHKKIDNTFPHTVFLFELRKESRYVIWNEPYEDMTNDAGKGGYDVFKAFSVTLLELISDLYKDGRIQLRTFKKIKKDLFYYLCSLYFNEVLIPTNHSFIIKDVKKSMSVYYGQRWYWWMIIREKIAYFKYITMHSIK